MWKTKFALYFYYLAISLLTICAIVIVVKLIVFPPCTPQGKTCIVDPWSAAGLEGAVLSVSATVLAILGAVAVAGWWTSLNDRVKDQVTVIYESHKKEIGQKLDDYVAVQQREVSDRLGAVQTNIQSVESRISTATTDIDELVILTHDFLDVAVDGIMLSSLESLEPWAQKVTAIHKFPKVPIRMTERYLDEVVDMLAIAEKEVMNGKDELNVTYEIFKSLADTPDTDAEQRRVRLQRIGYIGNDCRLWLQRYRTVWGWGLAERTLNNWERVLRWRNAAADGEADPASIQKLEEKISSHQFKLDLLKLGYTQLTEQTQRLLGLTESYLQTEGVEKDTSVSTN